MFVFLCLRISSDYPLRMTGSMARIAQGSFLLSSFVRVSSGSPWLFTSVLSGTSILYGVSGRCHEMSALVSEAPPSLPPAPPLLAAPEMNAEGEGATPLMYACQQGRDKDLKAIMSKKPAAVRERDRTLKSALHYCAENSTVQCAETVLTAAPELLDARDEDGYTTLHLAVIAGNCPLIRLLLARGADVNCLDNERHSVVHWATGPYSALVGTGKAIWPGPSCTATRSRISEARLARAPEKRSGLSTGLVVTVTPPKSTLMVRDISDRYFTNLRSRPKSSNFSYVSSLCGEVEALETVLEAGAMSSCPDMHGGYPLHYAAQMCGPAGEIGSSRLGLSVLHALLSHGVEVNVTDQDGRQPILWAASAGCGLISTPPTEKLKEYLIGTF
ncbi:Ankyrin repeat [Homalodisca vitripennis]|nr:Ankyrin repeat [Homalodisca vitripennis]